MTLTLMNQAILFNDDLRLIEPGVWQLSGFYQGELIEIKILSPVTEMNDGIRFDWEADIEDWLDNNEPEESPVTIKLG